MDLIIDIGNTNTVLGVYKENEILGSWRMSSKSLGSSDEVGIFIMKLFKHENLSVEETKGVAICSVVPDVLYTLKHSIKEYFNCNPFIITPSIKTGISIKYYSPKQLGSDRIANAVAAYELYGGPIIIVDFGTATKLCAVSEKGEHLGGMICPGIKISSEALFNETSQLPKIELERPINTLGKNTLESIQSGIIYGAEGMVFYLINLMKREMDQEHIKVIATGGLARLICDKSNGFIDEINDYLTLDGIRILYYLNK